MPDRRRTVVVATPLLALFAALVAGWSVAAAQEAGDDSDAELPLSVALTSSRDVCTANTLTELTWTITGGKPPYTLRIDGETVDPAAESHRINCGPLPETPAPDPAWEHLIEYRHARAFAATVTDARGVSATGTDLAELLPPLPAPETADYIGVSANALAFFWYTAEAPPGTDALVGFLTRWREAGSSAWTYEAGHRWRRYRYGAQAYFTGLRDPVVYEAAVAPMRHPLEAETPQALRWTPNRQATTLTHPANVTVTSTHDTVTVRWDRQPSVTNWWVRLTDRLDRQSGVFARISATDSAAWGDPASGTHEVTLRLLPPDTEYELRVGSGDPHPVRERRYVDVTVRTKPAPAGYTPLPRGPQNVRATSTATTITVTWDPPYVGAEQDYQVYLFGPDGRRFYTEALYSPPWTFTFTSSAVNGGLTPWYLAPETTYRIRVLHVGAVRVAAEISIATKARASSGAQGSSDHDQITAPVTTCIEITPGWRICPTPAVTPG